MTCYGTRYRYERLSSECLSSKWYLLVPTRSFFDTEYLIVEGIRDQECKMRAKVESDDSTDKEANLGRLLRCIPRASFLELELFVKRV